MHLRNTWSLAGAFVLIAFSACGPAGTLTGKVTVEGGSAAGIAVIAYGPTSGAAVTKDDGTFTVDRLPDGAYVVRATLRGAEVEELSTSVTITQGKSSEAVLNFKLATSKITGRVSFTDGSNPQGLTVNAVGPMTAGARTEANGSFSFDNLKSGAYLVSVEGPDTKEGRVAIGVFASGAIDTGELKLTPVGKVAGTVSYMTMPLAGVTVSIPGTGISAVTDDVGHFALDTIPAGAQTVLARIGTAPFFRSATVMTMIARGANPDLAITITDEMPATGQVTGVITFHGSRTPRDITVSAPGTGVMANPAVNGAYALALPEGVWDIVANAPSHPQMTLGRVQISAGRVVNLPGQELSWWKPIWSSSTPITGLSQLNTTAADATHPWSLVLVNDVTQRRLALVNATTFEFRVVAVGAVGTARISRNARYAGWVIQNMAFVYEIMTGTLQTFTAQANIQDLQFSSDESTLFIVRGGPTLTRIAFATPNAPTIFPGGGMNATAIHMQTVDRWFVQRGTEVDLVPVTGAAVTNVFVNVNGPLAVQPTAWALTNCAATCQLRVLAPAATQNVQDQAVNALPGSVLAFNSGSLGSRADFPCFIQGGTSAYCVDAANGTHVALAGVPSQFRLNDAGSRVIWVFNPGSGNVIREEPFPPSMTTTNLAASANTWGVGWLSSTRAYAFEKTGAARVLHLVTSGVDMLETDVGNQGWAEGPPLLVLPQTSTSRWRAWLGNNTPKQIDVSTTIPIISFGVRSYGSSIPSIPAGTRFAGVSFDGTATYVVDDTTVRVVPGGYVGGGGRAGAIEYTTFFRTGAARDAYLFFNNLTLVEPFDDVNFTTTIGTIPTAAALGLSNDQLTVHGGLFSL
ncbi:MAG: hypothetical protein JNM17_04480 [Archangium sp.]|nr:hypothetical protein [Archangium sp.]